MQRGGWLAVALFLTVSLSGCAGPSSLFSKDPMAGSTFADAGSNNTTWALEITGRFHLPYGTKLVVDADNETCSTTGLREAVGNRTYGCRGEADRLDRYRIDLLDHDADGRPSHGDHLVLRPGPGHANGTLDVPHVLRLALHEEVPLFLLEQGFGPEGPIGPLRVELLG